VQSTAVKLRGIRAEWQMGTEEKRREKERVIDGKVD
jgi:hypothetical protein